MLLCGIFLCNWYENVESYLANRQRYVNINSINLNRNPITFGVPQGSVLWPPLLLLSINDLPNVSERIFAVLFADDTSVFSEGKELVETNNVLNAKLAKLTIWLSSNKLTLIPPNRIS